MDRLRLDDQLCFALYAATNAITRRYRPLLGEIGLTYPQYLVMLTLWQDGPTPIGQIARRLELDSHAVSPLVDRLEAAGLVVRRPGSDRRQVVVEATPRGRDLEAAAARAQADVACATGLDPLELAELRRRLRDLAAELNPRTSHHPAAGGAGEDPPRRSIVTQTVEPSVPDTRRLAPEADPSTAPAVEGAEATLYERLGGVYGISGAVDILVDRLFENVNVNANDMVHQHHGNPANAAGYKFLVAAWSIEAAGGPKCYIGHDMTVAHEHLKIDKDGFDAVWTEIDATLNYVGVPDKERTEFMDIIESYRSQVVQA